MMKHVVALWIVAVLVGGCDNGRQHVEPEPSAPTTTASPTPTRTAHQEPSEFGPAYAMPPNLCHAISWTAFTQAYPDQPVRQMTELGRKHNPEHASTATCTAFVGKAEDGLFLTIEVKIYANAALAGEEYTAWKNSDSRRLSSVTSVDALGAAAYSMSDRNLGPALVAVNGNALLRFSVRELGTAGHIPLGDPIQRLRALASAIIANLPQSQPSITVTTWPPHGPQP